jgi:A/G-specific adenine glycosylase
MDYGAMLGKIERDNPNRRSSAYRRQPKFEGSRRQLRGEVLRLLLKKKNVSKAALKEFSAVLPELLQEGFIRESKGKYRLV